MPRRKKSAPAGVNPRKVDQHFRVVLPAEVIEALGLEVPRVPGNDYYVHFTLTADGRIELQRVRLTLE
ncbi:MAG TPA: hypothetical protein VM241_06810 [Candidatus Thermoplasmatota archaeon]|nr:hypothetical protein [Candidatus Thermoplasmatota archaeon]